MPFRRSGTRNPSAVVVGRGQRRKTLWLANATVRATLSGANAASLTGTLSASALALRPFTIVRTHGIMHIESDQDAASEFQEVAVGGIVVTDQAQAIGVTAVPTPTTEDSSDWFVYARLMHDFLFGSAIGFSPQGAFLRFDSKAMRKVDLGSTLIHVVESSSQSQGVIVSLYMRTLIKLH